MKSKTPGRKRETKMNVESWKFKTGIAEVVVKR